MQNDPYTAYIKNKIEELKDDTKEQLFFIWLMNFLTTEFMQEYDQKGYFEVDTIHYMEYAKNTYDRIFFIEHKNEIPLTGKSKTLTTEERLLQIMNSFNFECAHNILDAWNWPKLNWAIL